MAERYSDESQRMALTTYALTRLALDYDIRLVAVIDENGDPQIEVQSAGWIRPKIDPFGVRWQSGVSPIGGYMLIDPYLHEMIDRSSHPNGGTQEW